jgi:uncharacterized protein (DUF433 family)
MGMPIPRITVDPGQMGGAEILDDHPDLEPEDIRAALHYAAEAARERILPLDPVT